MKIKIHQSIAFRILLFYILLSLISLSFVVSIIFENQTDLISQNTRLESERQFDIIINSIKKFSAEMRKGSLFISGNSKDALMQTCKILGLHSGNYIVFSENGDIIHRAPENITPPETYIKDGLRSITVMNFSGKEYYLRIDEKKQVMFCYIPLSGFRLGNYILMLEKKIGAMNESLMHLYSQAFYVIMVVFFFHAVFAVMLFRYIIQPVNLLARGAESLTEGKLETRIHIPDRQDEFASLASAFNRMAETMHSNIDTLSSKVDSARENIQLSEKMTTRDALTGFYNRRYILERIDEEIIKTRRNHTVLGLMLAQIDDFNGIISIYGQQTKNILLSETAKTISHTSPGGAIAGRYGDESFALFFTDTTAEEIEGIAENINRAVEEKITVTPDGKFKITVSIGITCYDTSRADGNDRPDIPGMAEEALIKARAKKKQNLE